MYFCVYKSSRYDTFVEQRSFKITIKSVVVDIVLFTGFQVKSFCSCLTSCLNHIWRSANTMRSSRLGQPLLSILPGAIAVPAALSSRPIPTSLAGWPVPSSFPCRPVPAALTSRPVPASTLAAAEEERVDNCKCDDQSQKDENNELHFCKKLRLFLFWETKEEIFWLHISLQKLSTYLEKLFGLFEKNHF